MERLILVRDGYYHADARARRRAAMILAMDRGQSPTAVARSARCDRSTVYYWLHRYLHHRDPLVLISGQSSGASSRDFRAARDLNAMKMGKRGGGGKLHWDDRAKAALRLDARIAPEPPRRLRAAILWAVDRGIPVRHVAHVAGQSRTHIYRVLNAANSRPFPGGDRREA